MSTGVQVRNRYFDFLGELLAPESARTIVYPQTGGANLSAEWLANSCKTFAIRLAPVNRSRSFRFIPPLAAIVSRLFCPSRPWNNHRRLIGKARQLLNRTTERLDLMVRIDPMHGGTRMTGQLLADLRYHPSVC